MSLNKQHIRLIFGLKVRHLRQEKGLSFAELSQKSGLSVSYLNEIEKGKKYPKTDKIIELARALEVSYDQLVSVKLSKKLAPISELLSSGFLESIPLELFGLETGSLLELISSAPTKINAFISSIIKISRSYEMRRENFYFAALRSFQEMHDNYFEEIEAKVEEFIEKFEVEPEPPIDRGHLERVLVKTYGYKIDRESLGKYPGLMHFRSTFDPVKKVLYVNPRLTYKQNGFLLGRELAFNFLELEDRPYTSNLFEVTSFESVLNSFKASYFSTALLLSRKMMKRDLEKLFGREQFNAELFLNLIRKREASPEMYFTRMSNLLPRYFGIDQLYFLRFKDALEMQTHNFHINKELHISRQHSPHENHLNEHYCRRWVGIKILQHMRELDEPISPFDYKIDVQKSRYIGSNETYFTLTIARPNAPTPHTNVSVTLGILIDRNSQKRIKFINHDSLPLLDVGETCERCVLTDCSLRAAKPVIVQQVEKQIQIRKQLSDLSNQEEILI